MLTLDLVAHDHWQTYSLEKLNILARSCQEPYNVPVHENFVHTEIINQDNFNCRIYHDGWQIVHVENADIPPDIKFLRQLAKRAICIQHRQIHSNLIRGIIYPTTNQSHEQIFKEYSGQAQPYDWPALNNYIEPLEPIQLDSFMVEQEND